jgi:YYY domain-containing protein
MTEHRQVRGWVVALALGAILVAGGYLRFLNMDWDSGTHLHPDERFLTMVQGALELPRSFGDYLDTDTSLLNPRNVGYEFFVYGTWPMTLVHLTGATLERLYEGANVWPFTAARDGSAPWLPRWLRGGTDYGSIYLVGRGVSAVLDLGALLLLFAIGARLYDRRVGLLAAALGAFTAFHIQQSHFFTVDTATNFFVLLCLLGAVEMVHRRSWRGTVLAGVGMGMAVASKIAVWPLALVAMVALGVVAWRRTRDDAEAGAPSGRAPWIRAAAHVVVLGLVAFAALRVAQPDMFAGPGWSRVAADPTRLAAVTAKLPPAHWWRTMEAFMPAPLKAWVLPDPRWVGNMNEIRGQVTGYGMDWPPNHQWFNRTPYVFPWKNMVLWGMGLPLGLAASLAWLAAGWALARGRLRHLLPWLWVGVMFAYQGGGWVKTMRYFLVIYPLLTLLAAWALLALWDRARRPRGDADSAGAAEDVTESVAEAAPEDTVPRPWTALLRPVATIALVVVLLGTMAWGYMFSRIYTRDHTRVTGSRWLYHHAPTAFGLTLQAGQALGQYLPASHPGNVAYQGNRYRVDADGRLDAMRVIVPGEEAVTIDGAQLAWVTDPAGDPGAERFHAWLTTRGGADPDGRPSGVLAEGEASVALSKTAPQQVRIALTPTLLEPGGEYYLWVGVTGAPVDGRPSMLGTESRWDDAIPVGLDGYGGFDDENTAYGEGMFGSTHLELYDEDFPDKVDRMVEAMTGADYIVITSNRVYGAVAQVPKRYPMTLHYYDLLFGGQLGFEPVADIHSYPTLGPVEVSDQAAEEAWSVYDHPKVDIYIKTADFDPAKVRAALVPATARRDWTWPTVKPGLAARALGVLATVRGGGGEQNERKPVPPDALDLSPARRLAQRVGGTWSALFDADGLVNRQPALAVLAWYLALALLGIIAFPFVATALDNLADRGWAVSRTAGLLLVAWLGWLLGSTGRVPHTPALVWTITAGLALVSAAVAWRRRADLVPWVRRSWRVLLAEEVLFAVLFALFLAIRAGNPDLWHPYYGGEKPMDFAYLNAVLRTVSFPPYDPWFAGGQMNYYYFGFVVVGALVKLTGIVPWVAYNLAIPTLAALTGAGVAGIAYAWARSLHRGRTTALGTGLLAALLAVVAGNLYQIQFIARRLADISSSQFVSHLPGVQTLGRAFAVLIAPAARKLAEAISGSGFASHLPGMWILSNALDALSRDAGAHLAIDTGHWYWNASRAIPAMGDVEPITEFPFFTFLYADLHAHMMALPITVLALAVALSWALPPGGSWLRGLWRPGRLLALFLGALAVGALWPANTWDYPTYGLVAAGALAVGAWRRFGRPSLPWAWSVALQGLALLALSLVLFWPYHHTYVQPYSEFSAWQSVRTPLSAYLTVHGVFLFALVSWAVVAVWRALADARTRRAVARMLAVTALGYGALFAWLWLWSRGGLLPGDPHYPSPWTPALGAVILALGTTLLLRSRCEPGERFLAWLLVLGTALTMFVEYVVLSGDIGRMNTVFKFYIQVWILWSVGAAVAVAQLAPALRRTGWGRAWRVVLLVLVTSALVYPVTAAPAKIRDRFPKMDPQTSAEDFAAKQRPGLSGIAYEDYAVYDDDGHYLHLAYDRDAYRWMQDNLSGTPVILEGYRDKAYRWGSRYSIHTGLPTVIGWDWHQKQQRAGIGGGVVDTRVADVREMYDSTDMDRAWALLNQYGVEYVIVGEMERAYYAADGVAKFDRMVTAGRLAVVYENPGVTIYRVVRAP